MSGCRKCRHISVKQNLKIEAHWVVSECTVCVNMHVAAHYILCHYFFTFSFRRGRGGGGIDNLQ